MVSIDLQCVYLKNDDEIGSIPSIEQFKRWVESSLVSSFTELEQTVRVVSEAESQSLNSQYRGKDQPTNVLSFPSDSQYLDYECLGDLVICAPVIELEALEQGKPHEAHWAHMVVHGMLHLQGFDHQNDQDADEMETLEIKVLSTLGLTNPYNELHV